MCWNPRFWRRSLSPSSSEHTSKHAVNGERAVQSHRPFCFLAPVPVRRFGRFLEFTICLVEQLLRLLRVTIQIELIGLLSSGDPVVRLVHQTLCSSEVR